MQIQNMYSLLQAKRVTEKGNPKAPPRHNHLFLNRTQFAKLGTNRRDHPTRGRGINTMNITTSGLNNLPPRQPPGKRIENISPIAMNFLKTHNMTVSGKSRYCGSHTVPVSRTVHTNPLTVPGEDLEFMS
jgi:hypothetical protein